MTTTEDKQELVFSDKSSVAIPFGTDLAIDRPCSDGFGSSVGHCTHRSHARELALARGRTPTGRRLRESVARAARHAPRDVVIVWRSAASQIITTYKPCHEEPNAAKSQGSRPADQEARSLALAIALMAAAPGYTTATEGREAPRAIRGQAQG
jgi:hypothetical protein